MKPVIVIEPTRQDAGGGATMPMWVIGVRLPDGEWERTYPLKMCFTEPEAWALAGLLSGASGHPVVGVDVTAAGETLQ